MHEAETTAHVVFEGRGKIDATLLKAGKGTGLGITHSTLELIPHQSLGEFC